MYFEESKIQMPLIKWVSSTKDNQIIFFVSFMYISLQFLILKYLYPLPNFLPDSYSYILAAGTNQDINLWPIGYSKVLRFISSITHSHVFLVLIQYLLLNLAILYLIFTLKYIFKTNRTLTVVLLCLSLINPLTFYICNFVSSDGLFSALSITWFTQLIWIWRSPSYRLLLIHGLILFLAFSIRFNSIYYPLVSVLLLVISKTNIKLKLAGSLICILVISFFIVHSYNQYLKITGMKQIAAFGGWQLASNALYSYANVPSTERKPVPKKFEKLHQIVNKHIDSLSKLRYRPDSTIGIYYLWNETAPLKLNMGSYRPKDTLIDGFKKWIMMGPDYAEYGIYLIKTYPTYYLRYFLLPNIRNYYAPETEFLGITNMGKDSLDQVARDWFMIKGKYTVSRFDDKRIIFTEAYPIFLAIINIAFVLSFISFWLLKGSTKTGKMFCRLVKLTMIIWLLNLAFSVVASPIVLRYQIFPLFFTTLISIPLISFIIKESRSPDFTLNEKESKYSPFSYQ